MKDQISFETYAPIDTSRYPATAQLQRLFHSSLDIICSIGADGRFVHVSGSCRKILGYAPEELISQHLSTFLHEEDVERTMGFEDPLSRGKDIINFENRYRSKAGTFVTLNWSCHYDKEEALLFCIGRDVSGQKEKEVLQTQYEQKLLAQNLQMNQILERITDGFFAVDSNWIMTYWNRKAEQLSSRSRTEMVGKTLWACFPQRLGTYFEVAFRKSLGQQVPIYLESPSVIHAGQLLEFSIYPSQEGLTVFYRDISEKKKTEEEMRKLSLIAKETTDGVAITERDLQISWVNDAFTKITGYSFEEAVGQKNTELLQGPQTNPVTAQEMRRCFLEGKGFHHEILVYTKAGEPRWLDITGQPLIDEQGKVLRFFTMHTDITERKRVEDELRRSNELFRLAAKTDAIYDWDMLTDHLSWGEGLQDMFGYTSGEFQMEHWMNALQPEESQELVDDLYRVLNDPRATQWKNEYRMRRKDGVFCFVYERGHIVRNEDGKASRMVGVLQNITERKMLEQELDFERKQTTAVVIKAQEQERAEVGRELHDNVNQILTSVKLYQELALSGFGNQEELLIKSMNMLQDAIDVNRNLSKRLATPTLGDIKFVDSVKELVETVAATRKFTLELDTHLIRDLHVSEELHLAVYRILQEHLTNVLKHSAASHVQVAFGLGKDKLELKITDDGIGFNLPQKRSGTGITNMKMRAQNVNGTIIIDTAMGKGCKVTAQFPLLMESSGSKPS